MIQQTMWKNFSEERPDLNRKCILYRKDPRLVKIVELIRPYDFYKKYNPDYYEWAIYGKETSHILHIGDHFEARGSDKWFYIPEQEYEEKEPPGISEERCNVIDKVFKQAIDNTCGC